MEVFSAVFYKNKQNNKYFYFIKIIFSSEIMPPFSIFWQITIIKYENKFYGKSSCSSKI